MSESEMEKPVTRRELREELAKLATKAELREEVAKLATKAELREEVAKLATKAELHQAFSLFAKDVDARFERVDHRFDALEQRFEQRFDQRFEQFRAEINQDLARHIRAAMEETRAFMRTIDDQYRTLPSRVERLEAAVFPPRRTRRRKAS